MGEPALSPAYLANKHGLLNANFAERGIRSIPGAPQFRAATMIANIARGLRSGWEIFQLLAQLGILRFKSLILGLKVRRLLLERRILIAGKRDPFSKDGC